MVKCAKCGHNHHESYHLKDKLIDKGFPTHPKNAYRNAHEQADKAEKKKYGAKQYDALKKVDAKLNKHELAGKNTKSGKIEISKKVPKPLRSEISFHERTEHKLLRGKKK
jgi:hypothetical protein